MIYNCLRISLFFIVCCNGPFVLAQQAAIDLPDPALAPRPALIVMSGVAAEGSSDAFQTFFLSAERAIGAYQHLGVQYTSYLSSPNDLYSYTTLRKGSYEIGIMSKFFLHGRLSGRRSHLYYGPQVRFGARQMSFNDTYANGYRFDYQVKTTKVLFCIGGQYTLGHAVFEWSLPLGMEYSRSNLPPTDIYLYQYYDLEAGRHFTMLPSISLGFQL